MISHCKARAHIAGMNSQLADTLAKSSVPIAHGVVKPNTLLVMPAGYLVCEAASQVNLGIRFSFCASFGAKHTLPLHNLQAIADVLSAGALKDSLEAFLATRLAEHTAQAQAQAAEAEGAERAAEAHAAEAEEAPQPADEPAPPPAEEPHATQTEEPHAAEPDARQVAALEKAAEPAEADDSRPELPSTGASEAADSGADANLSEACVAAAKLSAAQKRTAAKSKAKPAPKSVAAVAKGGRGGSGNRSKS